nr:hypothetical protein [Tanacetum cinerariifolium]
MNVRKESRLSISQNRATIKDLVIMTIHMTYQYSVNPSLNIQNELNDHELFINESVQQKLQNEYARPFSAISITLDLPTVEPEDSLRIGDEHLDTIPETKLDEFIKSSVENLVPNQEIYSNPLFDDDIISIKIDPHPFNAESDLMESMLNHDSSIISSYSKIDSLLDEFADELILLKSIPLGIDETDCDPEEKFIFQDIVNVDYDSEVEMLNLEVLLRNNSLSLSENESFHFNIPSSPRRLAKPPDDDEIEPNSRILTVKVLGDISEQYVPMLRLLNTQPTQASNQEKSPYLLSHRDLKAF